MQNERACGAKARPWPAGENQSSVPKAYQELHDDGRMKDSPYRDRVDPDNPKHRIGKTGL